VVGVATKGESGKPLLSVLTEPSGTSRHVDPNCGYPTMWLIGSVRQRSI